MKGILKGSKPPQSLVGLSIDTHKLGVCEWRREEEEERQDWEEVRMSDLKQCFKEWGGGRSPSMDPLNVLMQAPPCLIPSHNPPYHSHWMHQTQKTATHTSSTGFLEMRPVFTGLEVF